MEAAFFMSFLAAFLCFIEVMVYTVFIREAAKVATQS
jgi:hypothetical protein